MTDTTLRVAVYQQQELLQGGLELIPEWSRESKERIWIDITSSNHGDIEPLLEEWFGFHELAAEDSLSETTLPKYDPFTGYDFFIFRTIDVNVPKHGISTEKLAAFLGKNYLVTVHRQPLAAVDSVWNRLPQDRRMLERGNDFLLYAILDGVVDSHFPVLDEIEEKLDEIHELVFSDPSQALLDELLHLKRDLNVLRRHTLPQRELFNLISRGDAPLVKKDQLIYFRDLYDHMFRIGESIDIERDLATTTMEAYLSVIANRTNEIMKVLTIFSSILLPINLIAGIYGMNFKYMPELEWKYGYVWAFLLMAAIAVTTLLFFGARGWLWPSRRTVIQRELRVRRRLRRGKSSSTVPSAE